MESSVPAATPSAQGAEEHGALSFPVVGIGASAGGLEAATQLLRALPRSPGIAFVLVQHLDPRHQSSLAELLSHVSAMPVLEAADGMRVEPDHVYVIPPNTTMIMRRGALHLTPRGASRESPRPIDRFLCSLAGERERQGIAVILSGTGSDGTLGLEAIKAGGGITFAQDETATYPGMPKSAIAAGCVDFVLAPEVIAHELLRIRRHPYVSRPGTAPDDTLPVADEGKPLEELFLLLRRACGVDFSRYKPTTIRRRIDRRMIVHRHERLEEYVALLRQSPAETEALYRDFLIHVTSFFRDAAAFDALSTAVFPALMQDRPAEAAIRIWVPGCSTGEEVYSIAICLLEYLGDRAPGIPIKLFGTDVSEAVVIKARAGHYPESLSADVSPERLRRFFDRIEGGYQIRKAVRELCVFARQDAGRDPPFSNLDLISCRNLLIYLGPLLQKHLLPTFHYALKENGFLLLGKSESVGSLLDLFSVIDGTHRIYGRRSVPGRARLDLGHPDRGIARMGTDAMAAPPPAGGLEVQREADRVVLTRYAPAGVVIDDGLEILQFRGDTAPYLAPAPGIPSDNLLRMGREGLLPDLIAAIGQAREQDRTVRREGVRLKSSDRDRTINLMVFPIRIPTSPERHFLVLFEPAVGPAGSAAAGEDSGRSSEAVDASAREADLERELVATREYLHEIIQKHDASHQQLLTANEEVQSSNEELQSTNEELQTAQEEMQATNEELTTVNEELHVRNAETALLGNDLTNLLASVHIPIVMLGRDLRIRRVTPDACRVLNLRPADVGRPISDLQLPIHVPDLEPLLRQVVDTLAVQEREVRDKGGRWYSLSIRPCLTRDGQLDGAVIALGDVDQIKRSEQHIKEARDHAESIVMTVREPLVVLDASLRAKTANRAFHEMFRTRLAETEGRLFGELGSGLWDITRLRGMLEGVRDTGTPFHDLEVEAELPALGRRTLLLDGRRVEGEEENRLILLAIEDVTERRRLEAAAHALERKMLDAQKLESLGVLAGGIAHDFNNILTSILGNANLAVNDLPPSSPLLPYLKGIEVGAGRAADLCAQMLAYSGRGSFVVERIDLSVLARETCHLLRLSVSKKAAIGFELADGLPAVLADATQIRQVLMNLVMNASEALGDRSGNITIATGQVHANPAYLAQAQVAPDLAEGDYVYLEVRDEGSGMSPETQSRIFDPFFTTKFTGRGLGLAAVIGIVRGHHGALRVESVLCRGSTFRLLLPRADSVAAGAPRAVVAEASSWRGEGSALVVDDEECVRGVVTRMLERLGFRVILAADGREGLEAFRAHASEVKLVLLDLTMPLLGGEETLRELRRTAPDVPVVLMSGLSAQDAVGRFAGLGVSGFLHKPFLLGDLEMTLRDAFAR